MPRPILSKFALTVTTVLAILALAALEYWHLRIEDDIRHRVRAEVEHDYFEDKKQQVELSFKLLHESIRTVSLLPSVRRIDAGNRHGEHDDVVARGDFSADAWETVQQIYNNLINSVSASEIYATVKGFSPDRNELPFFMFDHAVINGGEDPSEAQQPHSADFPEEYEEAEYAAINAQIQQLETTHPLFIYDDLNAIPMLSSQGLRTCDNTQYLSVSTDNESDSHGFLLSVPFYASDGRMNGVISAIIRLNALEALLLDVPFIPVTGRDRMNAAQAGFTLPDEPGGFVLYNPAMDVYIADRRSQGLVARVRGGDPTLIIQDLESADLNPWRLALDVPGRFFDEALKQERRVHFWRRVIYVMVTLFLFAMVHWNRRLNAARSLLSERNQQLKRQATTDALTGIDNRSHLDQVLRREKERGNRYNHGFGVILLDIDHFKQINDRHGHLVGDDVLIEVANLLKGNIRSSDTVGRWGGEEFLVICPEADLEAVRVIAEKLRRTIASQSFERVGQVTASFGIAVSQPLEECELAVGRADEALYRAKEAGRNRVGAAD